MTVTVIVTVCLLLTVVQEASAQNVQDGSAGFEAYFIDVGEGNAAVFICDGKVMMVDGGPSSQSDKIYSFLKKHGLKHIDLMVATHPDADHVGGLSGALNYAKVDEAWCTVTEHDTVTFKSFVRYLGKQGVSITVPDRGDSFSLGSALVTVLGPEKGKTFSNNTSVVLRVEYGKTSFLLTGDSEKQDEDELVASGVKLKSTLLLVGHHGSSSSTWKKFTAEVKPEYAVISVGENDFGHPSETVLKNLEAVGAKIYRTDLDGTVYCSSDGKRLSFETEKGKQPDFSDQSPGEAVLRVIFKIIEVVYKGLKVFRK